MEFYSSINDLPQLEGSIVTIGSFDGLHFGHRHVIKQVEERGSTLPAPAILMTFHPHPKEVLLQDKNVPVELLTTVTEKKAILKQEFELDYVIILPFTTEFSQVTAETFLRDYLIEPFAPREIIIGTDHTFGKGREGNAQFLQRFETRYDYTTVPVDPVGFESGEKVSSSRIRQLLKNGETIKAAPLLTRPYMLTGHVKIGEGRGRELKFPTANIEPESTNKLMPGDGVYLVYITSDVVSGYGMCNIGKRPTFDEGIRTVEVHIFQTIETSLYQHDISVHFFHRLRDEMKFESANDLTDQLDKDKEHSQQIIAEENPWKQYQKELVI